MMQEHNIRDIKVRLTVHCLILSTDILYRYLQQLFAAHGPYSWWDYIKRISASIPTQRKVKEHVEAHFNHFRRGRSHTTPKWEDDVVDLYKAYHNGIFSVVNDSMSVRESIIEGVHQETQTDLPSATICYKPLRSAT